MNFTGPESPDYFFVGDITKRCVQTIFEGPDSNYDDYRIYIYNIDGDQYGDVIILEPGTLQYKVCGLIPGNLYHFELKTTIATDDEGRIESDELEATAITCKLHVILSSYLERKKEDALCKQNIF